MYNSLKPVRTFSRKTEFAGLRLREAELLQTLANARPTISGESYSPEREAVEIELAEIQLALVEGRDEYNRVASDSDGLRHVLESELQAARAVYAECDADLPEVAPLESFEPEAVRLNLDERLARAWVVESRATKRREASERLSATFAAVNEAYGLVAAARKAEGMPPPCRVLPRSDACSNAKYGPVPQTVTQVDELLRELDAQRRPPPVGTCPSSAANHIASRKKALADFLEEQDVAAEKRRLQDSGEDAALRMTQVPIDVAARNNVTRRKAEAEAR